jgi:hypothetical protein
MTIKNNYDRPSYFLYKFETYPYYNYLNKINTTIENDLPLIVENSEKELQYIEDFIFILSSNWKKFIQYNKDDYCLFSTNLDLQSVTIEYCNSKLFKRSLEMVLTNIEKLDINRYSNNDFIFKIKSTDLKRVLNEKDSRVIVNR